MLMKIRGEKQKFEDKIRLNVQISLGGSRVETSFLLLVGINYCLVVAALSTDLDIFLDLSILRIRSDRES